MSSELYSSQTRSILSKTGCARNCAFSQYTATIFYNDYARERNNSILYVTFDSRPTAEETEVVSYDVLKCVADIGGYLGLLLGVSAMSLVEWSLEKKDI